MKITNKTGLPEAIASYADYSENHKYSSGGADWSVTTLIDSPRIHNLLKKHGKDLTGDAVESVFSMLGSALHIIFEKGAVFDHITEERLFLTVDGKKISGQIDTQEILPNGNIKIIDYKLTSVWAKIIDGGIKREWVCQQNMYAHLVEEAKGKKVDSINVCILYRDWSKTESLRRKDYPKYPIELIKLPLWSWKERNKFLIDRVAIHAEAREMMERDDKLPLCTPSERWTRGGKVALMRDGREKAVKLFDSKAELMSYAQDNNLTSSTVPPPTGLRSGYSVVIRPETHVRCESWCKVSRFCSQLKAEKVTAKLKQKEEA